MASIFVAPDGTKFEYVPRGDPDTCDRCAFMTNGRITLCGASMKVEHCIGGFWKEITNPYDLEVP